MTTLRSITTTPPAADRVRPSLGEQLQRWATAAPDRAAVQALVEEGELLKRDAIGRAVRVLLDTPSGGWSVLTCAVYTAQLNERDRAFIGLVLSIAVSHYTALSRIRLLDARRTAIILRALVTASGHETIAVGTRS